MNGDPTRNNKTKDHPETFKEEVEKPNGNGLKDFQLRITAIHNATNETNKSVVKTNKKGLSPFFFLDLIPKCLAEFQSRKLGLLFSFSHFFFTWFWFNVETLENISKSNEYQK